MSVTEANFPIDKFQSSSVLRRSARLPKRARPKASGVAPTSKVSFVLTLAENKWLKFISLVFFSTYYTALCCFVGSVAEWIKASF